MNLDQPDNMCNMDNTNNTGNNEHHQQIMNRMDDIERKLDLILQKLDGSVIKNCDKMGTHIDFVNGVYDTVKVPLNYISNKIHRLANPLRSHADLPLINNE